MANKKRMRILLAVLMISALALAANKAYKAFYRPPKTLADYSRTEIAGRLIDIYENELRIQETTKWMGIKIQQTPMDMWSLQEIVWEVRPDFIIETGTYMGGSALYFASLLNCINPDSRVITVDIKDYAENAKKNPLFQKYIIALIGSSTDDSILSEIRRLVEGKRALVFLDSDHHMEYVLKEMNAYARLVSIGSYMIVNDTATGDHLPSAGFGPGPRGAVREFLQSNHSFELDLKRGRFMLSFYPDGYLKRIR